MKRILLIFCSFFLLLNLCACQKQAGETILDVIGKEEDDDHTEEGAGAPDDSGADSPEKPDAEEPVVEIPVKEPGTDPEETSPDPGAEEGTSQVFAPVQIDMDSGLPYAVDLDGDGADEYIDLKVLDFGEFTGCCRLLIKSGDEQLETDTYIRDSASIWLADLDGDGEKEIFLSGDFASDDFITYAYRLRGGQIVPIGFEDSALWPDREAQRLYTFGQIRAITAQGLELVDTFDVLGSYEGVIRFTPVEDMYVLDMQRIDFDGNAYRLKTKTEVPVTYQNEDVEIDGVLAVGTELVITGVDLERRHAYFETADGGMGCFTLTTQDGGLTYQINGTDEFSCFELLPYAG